MVGHWTIFRAVVTPVAHPMYYIWISRDIWHGLNIDVTQETNSMLSKSTLRFRNREAELSYQIRSCSWCPRCRPIVRAGQDRLAWPLESKPPTLEPGQESHLPNLLTHLLSSLKVGLKTRLATSRYRQTSFLILIRFLWTTDCGPALKPCDDNWLIICES